MLFGTGLSNAGIRTGCGKLGRLLCAAGVCLLPLLLLLLLLPLVTKLFPAHPGCMHFNPTRQQRC
jgi:hypothetical protein